MEKVRNSAYNYSGNYYQMINQNQPNLANMKYTDPCFQGMDQSDQKMQKKLTEIEIFGVHRSDGSEKI